jgi:murein DD-endopeptidase MepM/ murein hydrolase activator NlpD
MKPLKGDSRFPLRVKPRLEDWKAQGNPKKRSSSFGSFRTSTRTHAGCDLHVAKDTDVVAVADGEVIKITPGFPGNSAAIQVQHDGFIALYGEVHPVKDKKGRPALVVGQTVLRGNTIAKVAAQGKESQLHFELYLNEDDGIRNVLAKKGTRPPFDRVLDPEDPTPYLRQWEEALLSTGESAAGRPTRVPSHLARQDVSR